MASNFTLMLLGLERIMGSIYWPITFFQGGTMRYQMYAEGRVCTYHCGIKDIVSISDSQGRIPGLGVETRTVMNVAQPHTCVHGLTLD